MLLSTVLARFSGFPDLSFLIKESIDSPRLWSRHSTPLPETKIKLRIGLPQPNFHVLEQKLHKSSNPHHERYGQYLSKEEVESIVAPRPESINAVERWLASFEIASLMHSPAKDWVTALVPIRLAEQMLNTKYHVWKHDVTGEYTVRTTEYSLPEHLHEHVDVVQPTTMFSQPKPANSTVLWYPEEDTSADILGELILGNGDRVDGICNHIITLTCLRQLYNATGYHPSNEVGNAIGVTGYLKQYADYDDLQIFYADQNPRAVGSSFNFVSINGGENDQDIWKAGVEADLDVQYAFGLTNPINATFYSTGGASPYLREQLRPDNDNEPYTEWLSYVLAHPSPPLVISTSYGDDEQTVPEPYANRICKDFAQLGARGVSVIFSSGDLGVGDGNSNPKTQKCLSNDGRNVTKFLPVFPASFMQFPRPSYQNEAVEAYLDTLPSGTYAGLYNATGRAYPDVSAQGDYFRIVHRGVPTLVGGTSASAPAFAGLVALLNDARLKNKQPPLGFLNPLLYSKAVKTANALNDITIGHNAGCGTEGFNVSRLLISTDVLSKMQATYGWDPVTGLGTPNFGLLKDIVTAA
ncbi:tripeptidyl peptidase A [Fistulina hepatica ATCC 64428]|uniref:Tripeptidyl peptidase A n=1 Tax=Fistulina hepatica ATCC 64428 TaxID=1128425 RepID=A0A0D7AKD4_9AGAR|nr:tripeptidyl peptidase A [Fistulina hepatica ATCC 64428]